MTGVVVALRAEARSLEADRRDTHGGASAILVRISGIGPQGAARAASELLHAGAEALLCFGVGGALDPALRCGEVVLATEILCAAWPPVPTCPRWLRQLETSLHGRAKVNAGALLTCDEIIGSTQRKGELFAATGALAVDMESAAVAQVASRAAVPVMALRVIADTAADALPPILQQLLAARAARAPEAVSWWPLARAPGSWPSLARLASRYRLALRVLAACARAGVARQMEAAAAGAARSST